MFRCIPPSTKLQDHTFAAMIGTMPKATRGRGSKPLSKKREKVRPRPRKRLETSPSAASDDPAELYDEIYFVVVAMIEDLDAFRRVTWALQHKDPELSGFLVPFGDEPYWAGIMEEVRRRLAPLPSHVKLAEDHSTEELELMLKGLEEPIDYWHREITKTGSTIPELMRKRKRHPEADHLLRNAAKQGGTRDQQRANVAAKLGVSVEHLKRLAKESPSVQGGPMWLARKIDEARRAKKP